MITQQKEYSLMRNIQVYHFKQISWNGSFCLASYIDVELGYRVQEKYAKKIIEHIDDLAKCYACKKYC